MLNLFAFEVCLVLMLYLEPPGAYDSEGHIKTISQGLSEHAGFGAALFVCVVYETSDLLQYSDHAWLCGLLVWVAQSSVLGVLYYPPSDHDMHITFAGGFFVSTLLLSLLRWYERKAVLFQVVPLVASFVFLIVAFYKWKGAAGPLEIVYLYLMLNSWVMTRNVTYTRALTSHFFK